MDRVRGRGALCRWILLFENYVMWFDPATEYDKQKIRRKVGSLSPHPVRAVHGDTFQTTTVDA